MMGLVLSLLGMYEKIFENDKIIIVNKYQGVVVEPDEKDDVCLLELVQKDFGSDDICLCHRLDRNTGGLVVLAKNQDVYETVCKLMDDKDIRKTYQANCFGKINYKTEKSGYTTITAYHFKDAKKGMVYIYDFPKKFAKQIITKFKVISYDKIKDISTLNIELVTGRTHQIRAQFSHIGNPVCGDGKYGRNQQNRKAGYKYQALWAIKLSFSEKAMKMLDVPSNICCEPMYK